MSLNVNRSDDTFYRYKMPRLITKIEGKGNGIKTVVVNMSEIAKAINRKPAYPTKFFGIECGAQVQIDDKNDRYIVNGVHDSAKLQELIYVFIQKFVLCGNCRNPETIYHIKNKKSGIVGYRCNACGNVGELTRSHRLTQYIVKNSTDFEENSVMHGEEKEASNAAGSSDNDSGDNGLSMGVCPDLQDNDHLADQGLVNEDKLVWSADLSNEASLERIKDLTPATQRLALLDDEKIVKVSKKTEDDRARSVTEEIKLAKKEAGVDKALDDDTINQLINSARSNNLSFDGLLCFVEALLCDSGQQIVADLTIYSPLFIKILKDTKAQRVFLGGIELLISAKKDILLEMTPRIIHAAYNNDLLLEEVILEWHAHGPSKRYVSKKLSQQILDKAKPFIDWLKQAEEESEDEDEEREDLNDNHQVEGKSNGHSKENGNSSPQDPEAVEPERSAAKVLREDDESDVDIDDL